MQFSWDVPRRPGAANTFAVKRGNKKMSIEVVGWSGGGSPESPLLRIGKLA